MTIGLSSAILEKGSHWITWHLGKRAVHQVRQTGEGKGEEKVCGSLRGRCWAFIDANFFIHPLNRNIGTHGLKIYLKKLKYSSPISIISSSGNIITIMSNPTAGAILT